MIRQDLLLPADLAFGPAIRPVKPLAEPAAPPLPSEFSLRAKRARDLILATLIAAPALLAIGACMALVKITSRGPALYSQQRVGRWGRVFTIYKVRTMRDQCEADSGPKWSLPGDPRITPLGRILRATHLDELPQLWNVFRNEMSLIGPRPERPEIAAKLREQIPGYDLRSAVLPGVTGLAQVHLPPDTTVDSVRRKLRHDLAYVRGMGLALDAAILWKTAMKVLGFGPANRVGG